MKLNTGVFLVVSLLVLGSTAACDDAETGTDQAVQAGETTTQPAENLPAEKPWPAPREGKIPVHYEDGIATKGFDDAPVTVIEYASMTCSHCATFQTETYPTVEEKYLQTGLVKLEFRPFPLDMWAARGSMIASCSGDKYFAFVELLFRRQAKWIRAEDINEALASVASIGGMGREQFDACIADEALFSRIVELRQKAQEEHKISSTPSFVINGKVYSGEMTPAEFAKHVDPLLPLGSE